MEAESNFVSWKQMIFNKFKAIWNLMFAFQTQLNDMDVRLRRIEDKIDQLISGRTK